jgi:hypothetical protein
MNKSKLDSYILDCVRKIDEAAKQRAILRDSKRSWWAISNGRFKCRICNRIGSDRLRSARIGICKYCMGE